MISRTKLGFTSWLWQIFFCFFVKNPQKIFFGKMHPQCFTWCHLQKRHLFWPDVPWMLRWVPWHVAPSVNDAWNSYVAVVELIESAAWFQVQLRCYGIYLVGIFKQQINGIEQELEKKTYIFLKLEIPNWLSSSYNLLNHTWQRRKFFAMFSSIYVTNTEYIYIYTVCVYACSRSSCVDRIWLWLCKDTLGK